MRRTLGSISAEPGTSCSASLPVRMFGGLVAWWSFVLLLTVGPVFASVTTIHPGLVWLRYLGGSGADDVHRIAYDGQGNLWVAGATSDPSTWQVDGINPVRVGPGGGTDAFVARLDPQGIITLLVFVGGHGDSSASSLTRTADGGVVVVGTTDSADFPTTPGALQRQLSGGSDAFVLKLSANGDLEWATLLGGNSSDTGLAVAAMTDRSVVVGGSTWSPDFPVVNPVQGPGSAGQPDGFVAVLTAGGDHLEFSTHLGGSAFDEVRDVALDSQSNIIAVGQTASPDFPVKQPYQSSLGGGALCGGDAFVTKLSWAGAQVLFSTYLGGSQEDAGESVTVDSNGQVTVVGTTLSANFPTTPGAYLGPLGAFNLFLTRIASDGSDVVFSARLPLTPTAGGPGCAIAPRGFRVVLNTQEQSWAVGLTSVSNFPLVNPLKPQLSGPSDGFISLLTEDGKELAFSTYLGGGAADALRDIAIGPGGEVFVAGYTESPNLPASQGSYRGLGDLFLARITTTAVALSASAAAVPVAGLAPLNVLFSGSASGGTGQYAFDWDFSDGSAHSSERNPLHTYTLAGSYTATLKVTDSGGAAALASVQIAVQGPCDVECTASAPLAASVLATSGLDPVRFSATARPASECTLTLSFLWDFGDGQTSSEQNPSHVFPAPGAYTWTMTATLGDKTCRKSGSVVVTTLSQLASLHLIPAVAHKRGFNGTQWRTDTAAVNRSGSPANLALVYYSPAGPLVQTRTVSAGGMAEWRDILISVFGLPVDANSSGTLHVASDQPLSLASRTYNQTLTGTLGSSYPPLIQTDGLTSGQMGVVSDLKKNAAFRTNLGVINLGAAECTVRATLFSASGAGLGVPITITLPGGLWQQVDDIFAATGVGAQDLAYATVEVVTPNGRSWAYGSLVDNGTGDPTTVPVVLP